MTLQDILLEQKLEAINRLDTPWLRYQAEAAQLARSSRRSVASAVRGFLASGLVRLGVWIDRRAGERAFTPTGN